MAISQAMCTSFKKELLEGVHNFKNSGGNTFKLALFTSSASLGAATTAYASSGINEVADGNGYSTGGNTLTRVDPTTSSTTAFTDFANTTFSSSTITANGAMIYNDTASGDPSVIILAFGGDKSSTSGDFTIQFPTADASNAIIRIA
jgi:hypothetical protein|tara:strand:+ start:104 stop:544 length:441 start_codon:yes stop_codon:yes gene_type:complete